MRGARGVLISITGGKDLTLYEVDEAATRIREEVDADANIIVGATFDESLDGIIRVSVVATGVDINAADNVRPATPSTRRRRRKPVSRCSRRRRCRPPAQISPWKPNRPMSTRPSSPNWRSGSRPTRARIPPKLVTGALRTQSVEDFPAPGQKDPRWPLGRALKRSWLRWNDKDAASWPVWANDPPPDADPGCRSGEADRLRLSFGFNGDPIDHAFSFRFFSRRSVLGYAATLANTRPTHAGSR